ncbi:MAG: sulfite exporter TauE/SafE family protein [Burkholderiaceae bacterium]|nr:sulfite exporter TauE/SafE family protein [Burkholderiaceae bacterium]
MNGLALSALIIGLWSAGHCLAMCGGLAIAAGQSNRKHLSTSASSRGLELLLWQVGRIASYTFMGFMAGSFGALALSQTPLTFIRDAAFVFANLMLIGLGLHVARLYSGVLIVERIGKVIWKMMAPLASATLMPQPSLHRRPLVQLLRALRAGMIWGWLPCGLVYTMLVTASVSGGGASGALWMAGFGLGTIPALWLTSLLSQETLHRFQSPGLRRTAGLLIIGFGVWGLMRLFGLIELDWLDAFCIGGQGFREHLK